MKTRIYAAPAVKGLILFSCYILHLGHILTGLLCRKYWQFELWPLFWTFFLILTIKTRKMFIVFKITVDGVDRSYLVFILQNRGDDTIK